MKLGVFRKAAREIVFPCIVGIGADKLLSAFAGNGLLNIMYHGVVEKDSNYFSPRHLVRDQFERQLVYIKKNFDIVTQEEAFKIVNEKRKLSRKTVAISFDDGFANNLDTALPLLEKHNVPVTIFISTMGLVEDSVLCQWAEYIAALRYFHPNVQFELNGLHFDQFYNSKHNVTLNDFIKSRPYGERDVLLKELIEKYDLDNKIKRIPSEIWQLLSPDQLRKLSISDKINIGSHAHSHYNLANISTVHAQEELSKSKKILEDVIQKPINSIAYPDGSYSDTIKDIAEREGYLYQLAVNYKSDSDILDSRILNRHGLSNTTTFESNILTLNNAFRKKAN
ncbi:MAG: polysaccharide deacetylase family protein [Salibacteraceae bacterium]|nr:polysaccharide deacetylase family protein [Salibacteraceae bacterium]MDP4762783.1 polysaccharide deacetylase family protein [Salibacteraceae bacterium]